MLNRLLQNLWNFYHNICAGDQNSLIEYLSENYCHNEINLFGENFSYNTGHQHKQNEFLFDIFMPYYCCIMLLREKKANDKAKLKQANQLMSVQISLLVVCLVLRPNQASYIN